MLPMCHQLGGASVTVSMLELDFDFLQNHEGPLVIEEAASFFPPIFSFHPLFLTYGSF
jgi:hypothetical protein